MVYRYVVVRFDQRGFDNALCANLGGSEVWTSIHKCDKSTLWKALHAAARPLISVKTQDRITHI